MHCDERHQKWPKLEVDKRTVDRLLGVLRTSINRLCAEVNRRIHNLVRNLPFSIAV